MIDWNGNGIIDPIDIGISIATEENMTEQEKTKEVADNVLPSDLKKQKESML